MNFPQIYFDEAGNTGSNLLDPEQPFFVLASTNFKEDEVEELVNIFETNSQELHFLNLRKSPKHQTKLLEFLNHNLIETSKVKFSFGDKKFEAVAQIVDLLIEPVYYDADINIYEGGMNLAYANILYIGGISFWDKTEFDQMVSDFVRMIRTRSIEAKEGFYNSLIKLYINTKHKSRDLLEPIIESKKQIDQIFINLHKYSIDPSLPAFTILCDQWYKELKCDFDILHDDSKQIIFWKDLISFISDKTKMEEMEVGFDSRTMMYPLRINELMLIDSKSHKGAQIADLIASSLAFVAKENSKGNISKFIVEAKDSKLFNMHHHAIVPSANVTPEQLGMTGGKGIDSLDYLVAMGIKHKSEYQNIMDNLK